MIYVYMRTCIHKGIIYYLLNLTFCSLAFLGGGRDGTGGVPKYKATTHLNVVGSYRLM